MKKFSNYEKVETSNFDKERLKLGGHICKIIDATVQTIQSKTGGNSFDQLIINFDIAAPDEQEGYYQRKFKEDAAKDALKAKWKGVYKLSIPADDGSENDEKSKKNFKTFITVVENSNQGYDWIKSDWDEKTLKGKLFGGIFGIEEFENLTGDVAYIVKCRFVRKIDTIKEEWKKIENGEEVKYPKVKCVDKSLMEYDEWLAKRKAEREGTTFSETSNPDIKPIDSDEDLPF